MHCRITALFARIHGRLCDRTGDPVSPRLLISVLTAPMFVPSGKAQWELPIDP